MHTTALALQQQGLLGPYSIDILLCWSVLAQLTGFTLVYIGYLPERSSFLFKLTSISAALLLAAINGTCWIIAPSYFAQFEAPGMVTAGQEIRFSPNGHGGYAVGDAPQSPAPMTGRRIGPQGSMVPLPFTFPFYGRKYQAAYVSADGTVAFDHVPHPAETVFHYGAQPTIYPLLVSVPKAGTDVRFHTAPKRLVITRRDRCAFGQEGCYGFQTVLHADGRIDFVYLAIPAQPRFQPFKPLASPWLMGITPGNGYSATGTSPQVTLIRDYHHEFLTHIDRLYAPLVPFLIGALCVLIVGLPQLLRGFLVRPLEQLLEGMRQFRDGDLGVQVPVSFNDEIGYLTESFNAMARSQHDMVHGLETMVAQRVAEVTDVTARNAQLEERNRLSADLHDSVSQTLFSAALLSDALPGQWRRNRIEGIKTLERLGQFNRDALNEMRLLLTELRNGVEEDQPPGGRIKALVAQFEARHGLKAQVDISGDAPLPAEVRTVFHRITQESLNNIAKHAQAANVRVAFEALPGQALLVIADDGQGFDPTAIEGDHLGLQIMRERAQRIGATLEIETASGKGTTTTLVWMRNHAE
ncbi:HAMP domain-containing protein [Altererythrobacter sp. CC-YST694]|uniref:HAMP domain-containing sensor histidine kinase n=1 Tax=Altererythrobacter sp. CC-YST694 TaxID=2755038 RepID=UPI001D025CCF|nr:histidine kinase [Altererythrobacter sp. CC-YST694]MCB5425146.1 HAMP domain-containing protein [Altererythrobacter sp. CC-YST694]